MRTVLLFAGILFGVFSAQSQTVELTLRVDMSEFTGTIDASGMHVAGNFPTGTWTPSERPMTDEGDGVWSYTETIVSGYDLEYKFVLGNDWAFGDEGVGGLSCSAPGTSNRALTTPSEDTVLPAVCWNSCNECAFVAPTVDVTFQVDMSLVTIDFDNGGPGISGTFNDFAFEALADQGDGIYATTIELAEGSNVQYKFRNGGEFESPFGSCATGDFGNRVLEVPSADLTLDPVCYASCEACSEPGESYDVTFRVDASQIEVDSAGMFIAGSFNGFSPEAMNDDGDGIYSAVFEIEEGSETTWKYLNGNSFDNAEAVPAECGSDDGFGGFNRVLDGPSENTALDAVCFSSCEACSDPGELYNVTFRVDASQIDVDSAGMFIAGSFNGFTPEAMNDEGAGIYSAVFEIEEGSQATWKYLNGNSFDNVETVPEECGSDDGFGGFNRVLTGPDGDTVLDIVCFGSCTSDCFSDVCEADGGTLTALTPRSICVGTGTAQGIDIEVSGASGTNARWGLIAPNGDVLATRVSNSLFSLDGYAPGNYQIRYIRYEDDVSLGGITNASQLADLEGCWAVSNSITIFLREKPEGGNLTALTPTTICANSGSSTGIAVELTGAEGELSRFGIRRLSPSQGNPIVASQTSPNFNLNGFEPGTYEVRHLSYQTGTSVSSSTEFFADIAGCFDASNAVTVTIVNCSAAIASSPNPTAGPSFVTFTNEREEYATLEVYDLSGRMIERIFNQVTNPGQEYRLQFDGSGLPNGVYLYRLTTQSETVTDKFMIAR